MTAQFVQPELFDDKRYQESTSLKNKRFALQIWWIVNGMVFLFFAFANYLMRSVQNTWPPQGVARIDITLPAIFSVVLLVSTFPANRVLASIRRGDRVGMARYIAATLVLGLLFLIGLWLVWRQVPYSGSYSAIFFTMTGFHGFHVAVGMLLFGFVWLKARSGAYSKESHWFVEAAVIFWYFIAIMWIGYFVILYIL